MWLHYKESHTIVFTEPGQYVIFPKLIVPIETAQFMLLFLDTLLMYSSQLGFKEKSESCDVSSKSHDASECTHNYSYIYMYIVDKCVTIPLWPFLSEIHLDKTISHIVAVITSSMETESNEKDFRLCVCVGGGDGWNGNKYLSMSCVDRVGMCWRRIYPFQCRVWKQTILEGEDFLNSQS